jgi:hypothetical protein
VQQTASYLLVRETDGGWTTLSDNQEIGNWQSASGIIPSSAASGIPSHCGVKVIIFSTILLQSSHLYKQLAVALPIKISLSFYRGSD